jgi:hypothetical protein
MSLIIKPPETLFPGGAIYPLQRGGLPVVVSLVAIPLIVTPSKGMVVTAVMGRVVVTSSEVVAGMRWVMRRVTLVIIITLELMGWRIGSEVVAGPLMVVAVHSPEMVGRWMAEVVAIIVMGWVRRVKKVRMVVALVITTASSTPTSVVLCTAAETISVMEGMFESIDGSIQSLPSQP